MEQIQIRRKKPRQGTLSAWLEEGEIFIRESLERGRDVQTVCVTKEELLKILALEPEETCG